jgi:hypothetical protein
MNDGFDETVFYRRSSSKNVIKKGLSAAVMLSGVESC